MNHVSPEIFLLIMAQLYYQIAKIFGRVARNLNTISTELNTFGCVIIPLLVLINMKNRSVLLPFFNHYKEPKHNSRVLNRYFEL